MNDLKSIRSLVLSCVLMLAGLATAQAVIIEGFSDTGEFLSVRVSDDGRLLISASTGVAQIVAFASSQPVNAFQATSPWIVAPDGGSEWTSIQKGGDIYDVTCISGCTGNPDGANVTTTPSTTTLAVFGQSDMAGGLCLGLSMADPDYAQRLFCNVSTADIWTGFNGGCTNLNGTPLPPGACYTPDGPITYSGSVFFFSTAPARISIQEIRKP